MAFSNTSILPPREDKPHICLRENWWRVSSCRRINRGGVIYFWDKAHSLVRALNSRPVVISQTQTMPNKNETPVKLFFAVKKSSNEWTKIHPIIVDSEYEIEFSLQWIAENGQIFVNAVYAFYDKHIGYEISCEPRIFDGVIMLAFIAKRK